MPFHDGDFANTHERRLNQKNNGRWRPRGASLGDNRRIKDPLRFASLLRRRKLPYGKPAASFWRSGNVTGTTCTSDKKGEKEHKNERSLAKYHISLARLVVIV